MYKKSVLANGLKIVTHKMPQMRSVALGIWIKTGGRYESRKNKGISHYLEHILFKGTKKYSLKKLKESIEGVGGSLNGFTSEEVTCYLVKLPWHHLDLGIDVLSDMVINPLLPSSEIEKERTVILEELKMYRDLPQSYVYDLLDELLWPGQPLGMSIIGSEESIRSLKKEDLLLYKRKYYTPLNIVVSASGLLEHDRFVKKAERIFSQLKDKNRNEFIRVAEGQDRPQLKLFDKPTEQTHIAFGFHSFRRDHPLKYAQTLLHVILGGNMSSRLFNEVREKKGLAYEIGTQAKYFQDTGAFLVHAGIDNCKVVPAVDLILKELGKIKSNLVTAGELQRAKDFFLGQLELALEDTMDHMLWIGESSITLNKTYSLDEIIKEVNKLTRKDILEAARLIFKESKINLSVIGPVKNDKKKILNRLRIG